MSSSTIGIPVILREVQHFMVVGGGKVGCRKIEKLINAGMKVTLISPSCNKFFKDQLFFTWIIRNWKAEDLHDCTAVFACTNDQTLNAEICNLAKKRDILYNNSSHPDQATIRLSPMLETKKSIMAFASKSSNPGIGQLLKKLIQKKLPLEKLDEYFQLMDEKRSSTSGEERKEAMQKMSTIEAFEEFLEKQ